MGGTLSRPTAGVERGTVACAKISDPPPMLPALLTVCCFACAGVFATRSTLLLGIHRANLSRLAVGSVLLALWAHLAGGGLHGAGLPWFLLSGFVGFGLGDMGLFAAFPRIGTRLAALMIQCLAAPIGILIESLWLHVEPSGAQLACGAAIIVGVALALAPGRGQLSLPPVSRHQRQLGIFLGFLAACGQAGGVVLSRKAILVAHAAGEPALDGGTAAYQRILAGFALLLLVELVFRLRNRAPSGPAGAPWSPTAAGFVTLTALAGPVLGVASYQWALATSPTAVVMPILAMTPIAVIPLAWFMENERPGTRSTLGSLLAVGAAAGLALSR